MHPRDSGVHAPRPQLQPPRHTRLTPTLPGAGRLLVIGDRHGQSLPTQGQEQGLQPPWGLQCQVFSGGHTSFPPESYHLEKGPEPSPFGQQNQTPGGRPLSLDLPGRESAGSEGSGKQQVTGPPRGPHTSLSAAAAGLAPCLRGDPALRCFPLSRGSGGQSPRDSAGSGPAGREGPPGALASSPAPWGRPGSAWPRWRTERPPQKPPLGPGASL